MASVTRRTGARGQTQRTSVEERLQQAMERLLAKGQSYTQVSVEQLALEAGIARGTFYLHFRDKGELVARLMRRVADEIAVAATVRTPETVTRDDLKASVKAVVTTYRRHYAVMAAIVETSAYDPQVQAQFRAMMRGLVEVNERAVQRLKRAGRLPAGLPSQVADVVTWAFERSCHQLIAGGRRTSLAALVESLTHVIWSSLYAPAGGQD
ncbi:MAG: TetR/AcrR family transcriptional regulator [Chiayiivirga sp.]|jgi:AcrR family transcriptional regulator|nr:TetR/AcrR family transcriptional regulator [Chiayiivirga sp.]